MQIVEAGRSEAWIPATVVAEMVSELLEPMVFPGDRIWGTLLDAAGIEHVVRLRVIPENGS